MKKLIGTVAVAAVLATAAFAEISFGAWLRTVWAPVAYDGEDVQTKMVNSWGGLRAARVNIDAVSENEKVGFSLGVYADDFKDGYLNWGDNHVIWVKPWDFLRVSLGRWDYTEFRGDLAFGSWNWLRPCNWLFTDEGLTFDQLGNKMGAQLELKPIDGLVIMWNLPVDGNVKEAYKMFEQSDAAVKYTIANVGTIKAGWGGVGARKHKTEAWGDGFYGSVTDDNYDTLEDAIKAGEDLNSITYFKAGSASGDEYKYYGDVNVAFDLTAVENLYVTVGAKISIADSDYKDASKGSFPFLKVALGASYQILDNLGIAANFGVQTYDDVDPSFQFGVGVNVGLTDTLTLNADFRGFIPTNDAVPDADPDFSFLVGLLYQCSSNGSIGIGFQGFVAGKNSWKAESSVFPAKADKFAFAIPIAVTLSF